MVAEPQETAAEAVQPDLHSKARPRKAFGARYAGLPDGPQRRKVDKIKRELIHRAKVKKSYAKVKARASHADQADGTGDAHGDDDAARETASDPPATAVASLDPHPSRLALMSQSAAEPRASDATRPEHPGVPDLERSARQMEGQAAYSRRRRPRPFARETRLAQERAEEAERRREERAKALAERERKQLQRERWRKQMAKARPNGRDGPRRLGRESKVLLEKVRAMMSHDAG